MLLLICVLILFSFNLKLFSLDWIIWIFFRLNWLSRRTALLSGNEFIQIHDKVGFLLLRFLFGQINISTEFIFDKVFVLIIRIKVLRWVSPAVYLNYVLSIVWVGVEIKTLLIFFVSGILVRISLDLHV